MNGGCRLVVGYDGSHTAYAALAYAAARAGAGADESEEGPQLFLVYGYGPPADWLGTPNLREILESRRDHGRSVLDAVQLQSGSAHEVELVADTPARAIADAARRHGADEIVIGSRGFGRLRGALGSVSQELLHLADRPVVIVPRDDRLL